MVCSLSASGELSRAAGRLSSQARYSSCRRSKAAIAAAQRAGRGASAGSGLAAGRDCAGAVWRGAGLGARPGHWSRTNVMPGHDEPLLSIVTVTFPGMIRGEPAMGAEHRAYTLVFGGLVQTRTMMQPCASTARFRGGGPIL